MSKLRGNEQILSSDLNPMLGWEEICEMADHLISFGAHTHTHPILSKLDETKAKEEIRLSKEIIEKQIGRSVYHFAFPNGRNEDFTDTLRLYCREIGFKSVLSAEYGNTKSVSNPFSLNRVGIDPDFPCWVMDIARLLFL
jgi:peptidoglycan/xylan/chitin deacetylase (PgdA/CDA1 family)